MNLLHRFAYRVSTWNRTRKWERFVREIEPGPETKVLDVGYQDLAFFSADNFIEEHYPWPRQLTALGIEEPVNFSVRYTEVEVITYDGRIFPFEDKSFDVVWSNAVIEHVGDRDAQLLFLKECLRVSNRIFVTTPNRFFPVEVHTRIPLLHWLPKPAFDWILKRIGKSFFADDYMTLLGRRQLRRLLIEAGAGDATIIRNRLFGLSVDFVVIT